MIFTIFVIFVIFVFFRPGTGVAAQTLAIPQATVSDAQLEAASAGRTVRIGLTTNGSRRATDIPIEVYVARVLAGEGEPKAAEAAHDALAIAIRTYVLANAGRHQRDGFDLCDTTHCQVVRNATPASRRAALATTGQVLLYEGRPAELFYSASCGGRSERASAAWPGLPDYPYLRSAKDDVHGDDEPWVLDLPADDILRALRASGFAGSRLKDLKVEDRSDSGRVAVLRVDGLRPNEIHGDDFRMAVGAVRLRSTNFSVKKSGRTFRFTGRGFGHGVGMCVIGAGRRSARGESAAEILDRYYPGLTLTGRASIPAPAMAGGHGGPPLQAQPVASPPLLSKAAVARPDAARSSSIVVRVDGGADADRGEVDRMAAAAHDDLSRTLGTSVAPVTIQLHGSIESFRRATGRPWWTNAYVSGTTIDLAPAVVLSQREGVEAALRVAVAEVLVADTFRDRPAWMRVGAARYFGRGAAAPRRAVPGRLQCPSDAELSLAASAPAQREAELRAEQCFVRANGKVADWRSIR